MTGKTNYVVEGQLSDNERLKAESRHLRGTITEDLQDQVTGGFTADNFQLIRFHGMYQQDDRDIRNERTKQNLSSERRNTSRPILVDCGFQRMMQQYLVDVHFRGVEI